jgi:glycosyltransferase involved in cell wall biosynthesis
VITSHGGDLNLAARVAPLRWLAGFVARRADACLGVSLAMTERFARLGVPPDRVHHVPLGVSVRAGDEEVAGEIPAAAVDFAAFPGLKVVYAGSLVPRKSVQTLLEAQQMLTEGGQEVACLIVGAGPCEPKLRAMAAREAAGHVVFVGEQPPEKVGAHLRLADVLVLPSRSEGLGLVLVQAMMLGIAVIASDIEGPRELIEDGVTGMLFPAGSSAALADRLASIIEAPGRARALGERGKFAVQRQGRTLPASAAAHLEVYWRIGASRRTRTQ